MSIARARVEARRLPAGAGRELRDKNVSVLLKIFKRKCSEYGIPQELKEREHFVRKCDRRRRKREMRRLAARQEGNNG